MADLTPGDAAVALRQAVGALSARMPVDPGELVPEAGVARLAAIADSLERLDGGAPGPRDLASAGLGADALTALDTWIRAADSFTLHDDAPEARTRAGIAAQLRAVRSLLSTADGPLTADPRDA